MVIYDDKKNDVISFGNHLVCSINETIDDAVFKASFIITSDLISSGKISALFDLIVCGDLDAVDIDVKGRFICIGKCKVRGSLVVQSDIWAEDIEATFIMCYDRIVAQTIDARSVYAERNIILGKTLAVDETAETKQCIICGETAFGSGRLLASKVFTNEPLDMDEGTNALWDSNSYNNNSNYSIETESSRFAKDNDFNSYLDFLSSVPEGKDNYRFKKYLTVLNAVELAYPSSIGEFSDISLLLWMIDIIHSGYFNNWPEIKRWTKEIKEHFESLIKGATSEQTRTNKDETLNKGYTVSHITYGEGIVEEISKSIYDSKPLQMATINFTDYGRKKFPIPDSLKYFSIISKKPIASFKNVNSISCEVSGFSEWISLLRVVDENREYLGETLYDCIFELLFEKIGLKSKFVEDRIKGKGWS